MGGLDKYQESRIDLLRNISRAPPARISESEKEALLAFYEATNGARWRIDSSWGLSDDISSWHGVTLDSEGRVIELILRNIGMTGGRIVDPTSCR